MTRTRLALLLTICLTSILAFAQYGGRHREMPSVDDQVNHLSQQLNLNDSQKTQVRGILQDQRDKMMALRQDKSLSREDRHAKMTVFRKLREISSKRR